VTNTVVRQLGGEIATDWSPEGLKVMIRAPLRALIG
jgi:two-component sensor histidine kinase